MKKIIPALLIIISLFFTACGDEDETENEAVQFNGNMTVSDSYAFRVNDDRLYIWDLESNSYQVFCSQPDCKHETFAQNHNTKCTAVMPQNVYNFDSAFIYNDSLYSIYQSDVNQIVVYEADTDGLNKKQVFTADVAISSLVDPVLIDGKLGFVGSITDTEVIDVQDIKEHYQLCLLDLSDMTFNNYGEIGIANDNVLGKDSLYLYNDRIYFQHSEYTQNSVKATIEYLDTDSKERTVVVENDTNISVWQYDGSNMYYVDADFEGTHSEVYCYDLDEEKSELLFEKDYYVSNIYVSGDRVFYFFTTVEGGRGAGVYNTSDGEEYTVDFAEDTYVSVYGHTSHGHIILYQDSQLDSFGILSDEDFWNLDFKNADFAFDQIESENDFLPDLNTDSGSDSQSDSDSQENEEIVQGEYIDPGFTRFEVDPVEPVTYEGKTKIVYLSNYNVKYMTNEYDPRIYDEIYIQNAVNEYLDEKGYDFYVEFVNNSEVDPLPTEVDPLTGEITYLPTAIYPNFDTYESMLANGEQVDIVNTGSGLGIHGGSNNTYGLFREKGYLEPLNDYLQTEQGRVLYEQYDEVTWAATTDADGTTYAISTGGKVALPMILEFNETICEEYGIDSYSINSLDDLEPYMEVLAEDYIYGICMDPRGDPEFYQMVDFCRYEGIYINAETAQAENIFENERALEYLEKIADYKEKGYIMNVPTIAENYLCSLYDSSPSELDSSIIVGNGYLQSKEISGKVGISSQSEHKEEAFQLLVLLNTDRELANIMYSGIEGRNYVINDGIKQLNKNALPYFDYTETMVNDVIAEGNYGDNPNKESDEALSREYTEVSPFYYFEITDTQLQAKIEELAAIYDEFYGVFYGDYGEYGDLETALAAANEQLKAAGIDEALAEVNRLYNEWKQ